MARPFVRLTPKSSADAIDGVGGGRRLAISPSGCAPCRRRAANAALEKLWQPLAAKSAVSVVAALPRAEDRPLSGDAAEIAEAVAGWCNPAGALGSIRIGNARCTMIRLGFAALALAGLCQRQRPAKYRAPTPISTRRKTARPSLRPRKATAIGPIWSATGIAAILSSSIPAISGNRCFTAFRPAATWPPPGKAFPPSIRPAPRSNGASTRTRAARSPLPPSTAGLSAPIRKTLTSKPRCWSWKKSRKFTSATAARWGLVLATGNPGANETARKIADEQARNFACGVDQRIVVGDAMPDFSRSEN